MSDAIQMALRQYGMRANLLLDKYQNKQLDKRAYRFTVQFNRQLDKFVGTMSDYVFKDKGKHTFTHVFSQRDILQWNLPEPVAKLAVSVVNHLPYSAIERSFAKQLAHNLIVIPPIPTFITKTRWGFTRNVRSVVIFQMNLADPVLDWHLRHLTTLGSVRMTVDKAIENQSINKRYLIDFKNQASEMMIIHESLRSQYNNLNIQGEVL